MVRNQDEDGPSGKPMMATSGRRLRAVLVSREFWLIVLIAIGVSWRLTRYFLNFPIFGDEAVVGLNILDRSYFGLLRPLRYIVACPIGFLWMSKYVMGHLGTSSYAVRLVPLLASLMSIPCMYLIARKFAGRWVALLAAGLLACSLSPARFSNDFKPYSIDLLVALAYTGLGLWALRRPRHWLPLLWLVLMTPLALVLSYPAVFVAGAVSLALAVRQWNSRSPASVTWYAIFNIVWLGGFALLFFTVSRGQLHTTRHEGILQAWGSAFPPWNWRLGWWLVKAAFGNMMSYPMGGEWGVSLLISPLCWLGAWRLWRRGHKAEMVLLVAPFLATLAASGARAYPYGRDARVEQHLVPAIMLLASLGLFNSIVWMLRPLRFRGQAVKAVMAGICTVLATFAIIACMVNVFHPWISRGWKQSQRIVEDACGGRAKATQLVILGRSMPSNVLWYLRREHRHWWTTLPASDPALHDAGADLWVLDFAARPRKNFIVNIEQKLAAEKYNLRLVAARQQVIYLGSASFPTYTQSLHFESAPAASSRPLSVHVVLPEGMGRRVRQSRRVGKQTGG